MHEFPCQRWVRLACILAVWVPLMACQPTAPPTPPSGAPAANAQTTGAQKNDKSEQAHLFKVNPSPKQVFEVEFEIHDAPGPLNDVSGAASYHAPNCNFVTSEWAGARAVPSKGLAVPMQRLGPNRFVATVNRDGLLDEDYYGKGVCQWAFMELAVGFKATGAKEETNYIVALDDKEVRESTAIRQYYWKGDYPAFPGPGGNSSSGDRSPDGFGPTHRNNLFSITAKVRIKP